ncbi:MAG TPA: hypothetical protein VE152_10475, partial [Acidimicrobiales bacterium]|nr:hypothetical protein [Acidimicrobiales bacterium]
MGNNAVTGLRRVSGRGTPGNGRSSASPWNGPPAPPAQPGLARRVLDRAPLAPTILGACLAVGLVRVLAVLGRPVTPYGDPAIIEIQTRMAIRFQALLGPYSRFGWHHPGPAYFYALAPFYALAGHSMAALVLGQLVINATAAIAVVLIIRRRLGEGVARWAAAAVGVYVAVSGPAVLLYVWNPLILSLPFLLMVVLVAVAATGSLPALAWAAVAGTFVGQSDVSAVPEVALVLVLGLVAMGARVVCDRRRGQAGRRPRRG